MSIKLTGNVRHNRRNYVTGEVIEKIKKDEAQRLVNLGVAFFVEENKQKSEPPLNTKDHLIDDEDPAKLLNENYSLEELKEAASEVEGLDFKETILKKDLIALIIGQDKVDEFFEDEQ